MKPLVLVISILLFYFVISFYACHYHNENHIPTARELDSDVRQDTVIEQVVFHQGSNYFLRTYINTPAYSAYWHGTFIAIGGSPKIPYDNTISGTFKFIAANKLLEYKKAYELLQAAKKQAVIDRANAVKQHAIDSVINDSIKLLENIK